MSKVDELLDQLDEIQQQIAQLPTSKNETGQALNRAYDSVKAAAIALQEAQQLEGGQQ